MTTTVRLVFAPWALGTSTPTWSKPVGRSPSGATPNSMLGKRKRRSRAGAGLWAGTFDPPWEWRAAIVAETAPDDCVIKGNISRSGERIYHLPFQDHYDRTRISEEAGERWFCSEAEALAAGWRRSIETEFGAQQRSIQVNSPRFAGFRCNS